MWSSVAECKWGIWSLLFPYACGRGSMPSSRKGGSDGGLAIWVKLIVGRFWTLKSFSWVKVGGRSLGRSKMLTSIDGLEACASCQYASENPQRLQIKAPVCDNQPKGGGRGRDVVALLRSYILQKFRQMDSCTYFFDNCFVLCGMKTSF